MNNSDLVQLRTEIFKAAAFYREKLDDVVIEMYADDLSDFTIEQIRLAYKKLRLDPKTRRLPLPAQVRETLQPTLDPLEEGRELASIIMECISSIGSYGSTSARREIGETGWDIVRRMGGWNALCASVTHENETTYMAQLRELCAVQCKRELGYKPRSEWDAQLEQAPQHPLLDDPGIMAARESQRTHLLAKAQSTTFNFTNEKPLNDFEFAERKQIQLEKLKSLESDSPCP